MRVKLFATGETLETGESYGRRLVEQGKAEPAPKAPPKPAEADPAPAARKTGAKTAKEKSKKE